MLEIKPFNFQGKKLKFNNCQHIHLMGICGTGMGAIAGMLKNLGFKVTGSDDNVYPPISEHLKNLGIPIIKGYKGENLLPNPDLVIVGNVISKNNPEASALLNSNIPYISFPEALYQFFMYDKKRIVVAGTHGKTTTSSLIAWLLESAKKDPSFMIGGILKNFDSNSKLGNSNFFVVEGDEYDTAFFDKVPKFLHYFPNIGVLTTIEFDHADIYKDFEAVKEAFKKFITLIPEDGIFIPCIDDPTIKELLPLSKSSIFTYGFSKEAYFRADDIKFCERGMEFSLIINNNFIKKVYLPLWGYHNVKNTVAGVAVAYKLGLSIDEIQEGLNNFKGIKRRQEIRAIINNITIIDDFAHHPTEVKETISAIRGKYKDRRIWAVFEPRSNTSMRNVFQKEFESSFDGTNIKVIIADVFAPYKVPENHRFSPQELVSNLKKRGIDACHIGEVDNIVSHLKINAKEGDVILIMSNGGFGNIYEKLITLLKEN